LGAAIYIAIVECDCKQLASISATIANGLAAPKYCELCSIAHIPFSPLAPVKETFSSAIYSPELKSTSRNSILRVSALNMLRFIVLQGTFFLRFSFDSDFI